LIGLEAGRQAFEEEIKIDNSHLENHSPTIFVWRNIPYSDTLSYGPGLFMIDFGS
jgi:hypothetical protein